MKSGPFRILAMPGSFMALFKEIIGSTKFKHIELSRMESLLEFDDGKQDLVLQIIEIYLHDTPQIIQSLFQNSDINAIHKIAHDFKSMSANVGANNLATLLEKLEKSTGHSIPAGFDLQNTLLDIRISHEGVFSELERLRTMLKP